MIRERGERCEDCGEPPRPDDPLDLDHIIPRRRGGSDDRANLRLRHHSEHSRKTARHDGRWG